MEATGQSEKLSNKSEPEEDEEDFRECEEKPGSDKQDSVCTYANLNLLVETSDTQSQQIEVSELKSPDVIQIDDASEEVKTYDKDSAYSFYMKNVGSTGPFSFADDRDPVNDECPPPIYFTDEQILKPLPTSKAEILQGLEVTSKGALICTDQEALDKQKGVLGAVAKQLAINLLKGLSISHISLPIKIFEPRSSI